MKKALFIDRDGTLIVEPGDEQIDTLEKLEYIPGVFRNLFNIQKNLDYELVIVSNQDGLGSDSYPEKDYVLVQEKMLRTFENEGIVFDDILIDKSFPHENAPTRKPRTGLLGKYMNGEYDLKASFVIGDRLTDIELAKNLGCKGILLNSGTLSEGLEKSGLLPYCVLVSDDWDDIYAVVAAPERVAEVKRMTKETEIFVRLNLDGTGVCNITTGLNFFDHMLEPDWPSCWSRP
jgi:imidazoleglycerol-phosphate dehydratase / histidinol-phosphatase